MNIKEKLSELTGHFSTGVSYMIPVVTAGGLLISIGILLGGMDAWTANGTFASNLVVIGLAGLKLIVPVISAFIAYSIADKPGIGPGLICGVVANNLGTGFLGGIVVGLMVGYLVELFKKITLPPTLMPLLTIIIIPLGVTSIVGLTLIYVIGIPIANMTVSITNFLNSLKGGNAILLSVIIGLMMAIDMGGPINKVANTFGLACFTEGIYGPSSAMLLAISIAPLGLALATLLAPKLYGNEEREAGKSAIVLGCIGITEGAIPFAVKDPLRVIPSIMIGTAVTTGLAAIFGVVNPVCLASIMSIPFVNKPIMQVIAIIAGVVVTALLVNLFKSIGMKKANLEKANVEIG